MKLPFPEDCPESESDTAENIAEWIINYIYESRRIYALGAYDNTTELVGYDDDVMFPECFRPIIEGLLSFDMLKGYKLSPARVLIIMVSYFDHFRLNVGIHIRAENLYVYFKTWLKKENRGFFNGLIVWEKENGMY